MARVMLSSVSTPLTTSPAPCGASASAPTSSPTERSPVGPARVRGRTRRARRRSRPRCDNGTHHHPRTEEHPVSDDIPSILKDAETKMAKSVEVTKDEFTTIRTGRANAAMFQGIQGGTHRLTDDTPSTLKDAETKRAKSVEVTKDEFTTIRTGRANAAMFQGIMVEYYGAPTPLNQLASLNIPEARTVIITPYDMSALGEV